MNWVSGKDLDTCTLAQDVVIGFLLFRTQLFRWDLGIPAKGWGELGRLLLCCHDFFLSLLKVTGYRALKQPLRSDQGSSSNRSLCGTRGPYCPFDSGSGPARRA